MDPAYDLGKLLFGVTGWLESTFGEISVRRQSRNEFEMEFKTAVPRRNMDGLAGVIVSSFDSIIAGIKGEELAALVLVALGSHFITEASHRLREFAWRPPDQAIAPHLLGALILSELDETLGTSNFDPMDVLAELRFGDDESLWVDDGALGPRDRFDNFEPPTDIDF